MGLNSKIVFKWFSSILITFVGINVCAQNISIKEIQTLSKQYNFDYAISTIDSNLALVSDHSMYLELLYEKGVILENFDKPKDALVLLNSLEEELNENDFELLIKLHIERSLIFEKLEFRAKCFSELNKARELISKHNAKQLLCFYHLRKSSSHRVIDEYDKAISHVDSALYYGELYDDVNNLSHCYLVKAFLEEDIFEVKSYVLKTIEYAKKADDKKISVAAYLILIRWETQNGNIELAMQYCRKIINDIVYYDAFAEHAFVFYRVAKLYEQVNKVDSALYYYRIGIQAEREGFQMKSRVEISEIIEKYENEKHISEINRQRTELNVKAKQLHLGTIFSLLLVAISIIALVLYFRGRSFVKKNIEQQKEIQNVNTQLSSLLKQESILKHELHHRVKNNLQTIISLLYLREHQTDLIKAISQQIYSISAGHELLYQDTVENELTLELYVKKLSAHLLEGFPYKDETELKLNIDEIKLSLESVIPIGLIINELITNSFKYAKMANTILIIHLEISDDQNCIKLVYKDNGPGVKEFVGKFGTFVIETMVQQLEGEMKINTHGLMHYEISLRK